MNNSRLQLKIKERLNKIDSKDYDNFETWQLAEAYNKAQIEWVRRQLHGNNIFKEGNEQSIRRVDDLQNLIQVKEYSGIDKGLYTELSPIPSDYMQFERVSIQGNKDNCKGRSFKVYQGQEGDIDELLSDNNTKPSFEWGETFCTLANNTIKVFTNSQFELVNSKLTYYRLPKPIQIKGDIDLDTGSTYTKDQICEFKDDIIELIIDEACSILAGDIESMNQYQRNTQGAERNN